MGRWLPSEIKKDKKSGVLDFDRAKEGAEEYTKKNINESLSRIQQALLSGDQQSFIWSKDAANEMVGQAIALAYATGYLDALVVKSKHRIIV